MSTSKSHEPSLEALAKLIGNPGASTDPSTAEAWNEPGLARSIEGEIIPRLMMLFDHQVSRAAPSGSPLQAPSLAEELDAFVTLVLENDADVVCDYIEQLRDRGESLPVIYLNLLAPAARRLGHLWESDECSFATVTLGISRMHQVLLRFSAFFCANCTETPEHAKSVLIIPAPGEQHTFGLMMLVEFFRREGWRVWSGSPRSDEELIGLLESDRFDVVGCSVSAERNLKIVPDLLNTIRERSRNKNIKIIVGGRVFSEQPELAKKVGADATAQDGVDAVRQAERLVEPYQ